MHGIEVSRSPSLAWLGGWGALRLDVGCDRAFRIEVCGSFCSGESSCGARGNRYARAYSSTQAPRDTAPASSRQFHSTEEYQYQVEQGHDTHRAPVGTQGRNAARRGVRPLSLAELLPHSLQPKHRRDTAVGAGRYST